MVTLLKSVKSWCNLPARVRTFTGYDGTGKKTFNNPTNILVYAEGKMEVITNFDGKQVVSNTQLYMDGTIALQPLDEIIFEDVSRTIQHIGTFYRNGVADLKVVYL